MHIVETKTVGTKTMRVVVDPAPLNPRVGYDCATTMWCWHGRYTLGDEADRPSEPMTDAQIRALMRRRKDPVVAIKPVYMCDHSGLTISTTPFSCIWDSGQIGWVFITRSQSAEWGGDLDKAIEAEVSSYDHYLRGDCYGYEVIESGEVVDSCWGYLGDQGYALEEGMAAAGFAA